MAKYYDHPYTETIQSEEIYSLFRRANKHPNDFIRIELTDEKMHLSRPGKMGEIEFCLLKATLIFHRKDGSMERYDIEPKSFDISFMAAICQKDFMVYFLKTPEKNEEGRMMFSGNETFYGIFKTATSTILITYDSEAEYFGYGYLLEGEGYSSFYKLMMAAMDTNWQKKNK